MDRDPRADEPAVKAVVRLLVVVAALACAAPAAAGVDISIVNRSAGITNAEIQAALPGLQASLDEDFQPVWGATARLHLGVAPVQTPGLTLTLDDHGPDGALGYHGVGRRQHRPFAVVVANATLATDVPWTVVASHELEEMLADPYLQRREQVGKRLFIVEVCDPVETITYTKLGVEVSDFVTPSWYAPSAPGPWDFLGKVARPLQVLTGGYAVYEQNGSKNVVVASGAVHGAAAGAGRSRHIP